MTVSEPYHWKEAMSTFLCTVMGILLIGYSGDTGNVPLSILGGVLLIGLSIVAMIVTNWWQYVCDLSLGKKIVAYIPVIAGGLLVFVAFFVINLLFAAFIEGIKSLD